MKKQSPSFEAEGTTPDYVRDLLDAGRSDAQRDYDVEAGLARHLAAVQAGAALAPWASELVATSGKTAAAALAGATAAKLATAKIVAGVAIAVVAAGAIAAMVLGAPEKTAGGMPASGVVPAAPMAPVAPPTSVPAPVPAPRDQANAAHEAAGADDAVELDIAPITAHAKRDARAVTTERSTEPETKSSGMHASNAKTIDALIAGVGNQQARASNKPVSLAPTSATAERSEPVVAANASTAEKAAATPAPAPVVDDTRLEREMGMLAVAQRVLKSDPERALRLARQGEQEFAGSMFTQERQQVLLLALIELGRIDEAKRLALPYLKRYPNGPFSDRLRTALATAKPEN
jgi:hypothetical protein